MKFIPEAGEKFVALVMRRNGFLDQPIDAYLRRSMQEPLDTDTNYMLARILKLRGVDAVSVRRVWVNEVTTAYFVLHGEDVVEVMTHRAFTRSIRKKDGFIAAAPMDGGRDGDRFADAMRHKRPKRVGGGLMRGRLTPHKVRLSIISTRSLRRVDGGR